MDRREGMIRMPLNSRSRAPEVPVPEVEVEEVGEEGMAGRTRQQRVQLPVEQRARADITPSRLVEETRTTLIRPKRGGMMILRSGRRRVDRTAGMEDMLGMGDRDTRGIKGDTAMIRMEGIATMRASSMGMTMRDRDMKDRDRDKGMESTSWKGVMGRQGVRGGIRFM